MQNSCEENGMLSLTADMVNLVQIIFHINKNFIPFLSLLFVMVMWRKCLKLSAMKSFLLFLYLFKNN